MTVNNLAENFYNKLYTGLIRYSCVHLDEQTTYVKVKPEVR